MLGFHTGVLEDGCHRNTERERRRMRVVEKYTHNNLVRERIRGRRLQNQQLLKSQKKQKASKTDVKQELELWRERSKKSL